ILAGRHRNAHAVGATTLRRARHGWIARVAGARVRRRRHRRAHAAWKRELRNVALAGRQVLHGEAQIDLGIAEQPAAVAVVLAARAEAARCAARIGAATVASIAQRYATVGAAVLG